MKDYMGDYTVLVLLQEVQRKGKFIDRKQISGCLGLEGGFIVNKSSYWRCECVLKLIYADGLQ